MELILGSGVSATKDTLNGITLTGITLTGITPLWYALESHNVAITRMMLEKGASANDKNSAGLTPLKFAVEADDFALAQTLMAYGADVLETDEHGQTLDGLASDYGHPSLEGILRKEIQARQNHRGYS